MNDENRKMVFWGYVLCSPFALVGFGLALFFVLPGVYGYYRVQSWEEVPAQILFAQVVRKRGLEETTWYVKSKYRYEYGGQKYTGDRVTVFGSSDSFREKHYRRYNELLEHQETGQLFHCYVDPEKPGNSVLYREFEWLHFGINLLGAIVFGTIGMVGLIRVRRIHREAQKGDGKSVL